MKILVFGSLNIDHDYIVDHISREKETMTVTDYHVVAGGKGLNQSIAIAKTGSEVYLAGMLGTGSEFLSKTLSEYGVNTSLLGKTDTPNGHAIIQIDKNGQNSIFVYPGSNHCISEEYIDQVLSSFSEGDYLVMQNEINNQDLIIRKAAEKKMITFMNPSPCDDSLNSQPLELINYFFINEVEGEILTGRKDFSETLKAMTEKYPSAGIILTVGDQGAYYADAEQCLFQPARKVNAIDTVGAGDTFMGYFIYALYRGNDYGKALEIASTASSITVQRAGAAQAIPALNEVLDNL